MTHSVLVVGEALVDEVRRGDDLARHPGGSPANVAFGLGRLGQDVALLSQWGADADGDLLDAHLAGAGVTVVEGTRAAAATSRAIATLDESGAASYEFDIEWDPDMSAAPRGAAHVHTGSIGAVLSPGGGSVAELVDACAQRSTVSLDPNIRASLIDEPELARERLAHLAARADVIKASDEDVAWLSGDMAERAVACEWLAGGAALVVLTRGADGLIAYFGSAQSPQTFSRPVFGVDVADTVGAGDSAMSGIIDALTRLDLLGAHRRAALAQIAAEDVERVVTWAAAIAAITVSRAGANPPTRAEVAAFFADRNMAAPF